MLSFVTVDELKSCDTVHADSNCFLLAYYLHDFTHIMFLCTIMAAILEIVNRMLSKVQN